MDECVLAFLVITCTVNTKSAKKHKNPFIGLIADAAPHIFVGEKR
jgi:hypothetical protein